MVAESLDAADFGQHFDPRDHVDRNAEQELFRDLVTFESRARILVICDRGGQGKSSLLKRLSFNCNNEIKPHIPSYLVELDKVDAPSPFEFASTVVRGFKVYGEENVQARFGNFNRLDAARMAKDFTPFEDGGETRRTDAYGPTGRAIARTMLGGQNIGTQTNIEHADVVNVAGIPEFTEDQERRAREVCAEALFDDLRSICATRPMVLIFDGWERCNNTFREWIVDRVLANHVLHPTVDLRPQKLAVVIAGRPYEAGETPYGLRPDEFSQFFDSDDEFAATVQTVGSLSRLVDSEHIYNFVERNGVPKPTEQDINEIREQIAAGQSLQTIKTSIRTYRDLLVQKEELEAKIATVFGQSGA